MSSPETLSRNSSPLVVTKNASTAPAANSGAARAVKTYAYRRSCRCRPGAMNAQSW